MKNIIPFVRITPPLNAALLDIVRADAVSVDDFVAAALNREIDRRRRIQAALRRNRLAAVFPALAV